MRLRVRGPDGVVNLNLADSATVTDLRSEISQKTGLAVFELKSGFPPQPMDLDQFAGDVALSSTGLKLNGEQLIAIRKDLAEKLVHPVGSPDATAQEANASHPSYASDVSTVGTAQASAASRRASGPGPSLDDPPEIPVPSHRATMVLRVMPDDNSCLFRALSSATLGDSIDSMNELRLLVASSIQQNPELYNEAVLEKTPAKYCQWISREDSWGGGIELAILSQHFGIEICSINVQDGRVDRFNEGSAPTRCILVYSGIHYDVVALSPSEPPHNKADVPADFDTKVFDSDDDIVLAAAQELCGQLQKKHYYTDTAGFSVKCNVCGWMGKGEKDAVDHAKGTGHMNFGES